MKRKLQMFLMVMMVICCGTACSAKDLSEYSALTEMDSGNTESADQEGSVGQGEGNVEHGGMSAADGNTSLNESTADELLDLFVDGKLAAHYVEEDRAAFYITDLEMGEEDYFSYAIGERIDLDNDGEKELILDGPYGGIYLDAREGQIYVLSRGEDTAEMLSYTEFDGKIWIVYSDTTHGGRKTYDLYCYDGNGKITDEFQLAKWFWDVPEDEAGTEYEYRGEAIDKEEYDSLYQRIFSAVDAGQKVYEAETYGVIESVHRDFPEGGNGDIYYYYEMEKFFVRDDFPNADVVNDTLRQIYDGYEEEYRSVGEHYGGMDDAQRTPYDFWHFLRITFVGEDYISILYNNVTYMGGAHPYSQFDGITVDCATGQEVAASDILEMDEAKILTQVSAEFGFEEITTWNNIDFYLTESGIVFFYRMPGYWDDVVWERKQ